MEKKGDGKMKISQIMKWVTAICEAFLAIPFIGGIFILSNLWAPLGIMFVLHIVTLFFSIQQKQTTYGSVMGIITSILGFIPIVGMILHMITALLLFMSAVSKR